MRVVHAPPPMFEEIDAAFNVRGRPVLFAFGDKIYNPAGVNVPPDLMAHEEVHGERQLRLNPFDRAAGVLEWWRRYIAEPEFRLAEELPAHVAEFNSLCRQNRAKWVSERNMRRTLAAHVARKLAAPLYGRLLAFPDAKKAILARALAQQVVA